LRVVLRAPKAKLPTFAYFKIILLVKSRGLLTYA